MGLEVQGTEHGPRLKVMHSVFQYSFDNAGKAWVFRYEYDRHPQGPHPPSHFHVRGTLEEDCLRNGELLDVCIFPLLPVLHWNL